MEKPSDFSLPEKKIKKENSTLGCISLGFALIPIGLILLLIIIFLTTDLGGMILLLGGFILIPVIFITSLLAFIFGIIGLKKNQKKGLSILGMLPFPLILIMAVVWVFPTSGGPQKLPWKDDFKREWWSTNHTGSYGYRVFYRDEALVIEINAPNYYAWTNTIDGVNLSNIHMEVTASSSDPNMEAEMGMRCYVQPNSDYSYNLKITNSGDYAISKTGENEDKILTNNGEWSKSWLITKNANSYRIGADCGNGEITLFVDGEKIDTVYDSSFTEGGISLYAGSLDAEKAEVMFDDLLVEKLK